METSEKVAFIHIPKTGGTYLAQKEGGISDSTYDSVISPLIYFNHVAVLVDVNNTLSWAGPRIPKEPLKNMYVCSSVRNVYSWLTSWFVHRDRIPKPDGKPPDKTIMDIFEDCVKELIDTSPLKWPSRGFLFRQMWADDADLIVQWVNHQETLDDDLKDLAILKNLTYKTAPKMRVQNITDYRLYYNDKLVSLVESTWKRDLVLFGYEFETSLPNLKRAMIKRKITDEYKKIRYNWKTDDIVLSNNNLLNNLRKDSVSN